MTSASSATRPAAPPPRWRRIVGTVGGVVLGAVLLFAAWAKMLDPAAFAGQIEAEGLDFLLPAATVALIAVAIEVFLGGALVLGLRRLWILVPATVLVVFFVFLTGRAYWRDIQGIEVDQEASCGCFGKLVERTPAEAFWQDLLLLVPPLALAFVGRRRWASGERTSGGLVKTRLATVGTLTAAAVLVAWKAPDLPLDDLATRLRPGADARSFCAGRAEDGSRVCLTDTLPEIANGEHLVVIADVEDETFGEAVARLNEYHWAGGPPLWVLSSATSEQLFTFRFSRGPAFEIREAPPALLAPLYRTLPRSFRVLDGRVVETYSGLPPLDAPS